MYLEETGWGRNGGHLFEYQPAATTAPTDANILSGSSLIRLPRIDVHGRPSSAGNSKRRELGQDERQPAKRKPEAEAENKTRKRRGDE